MVDPLPFQCLRIMGVDGSEMVITELVTPPGLGRGPSTIFWVQGERTRVLEESIVGHSSTTPRSGERLCAL